MIDLTIDSPTAEQNMNGTGPLSPIVRVCADAPLRQDGKIILSEHLMDDRDVDNWVKEMKSKAEKVGRKAKQELKRQLDATTGKS